MITAIATYQGTKIYTDHYSDGIFIDAFELNKMTFEEIRQWLKVALPLSRESQLSNMYTMNGRHFDSQFFYDGDVNVILDGILFTKQEKTELLEYLKYGKAIYEKQQREKGTVNKAGYVYLVRFGKTDYYKIGHTNDIDRRINVEIAPKMPEEPEIIHTIKTKDRFKLESELHKRYADKRKNGEWFELSQDDIDYIRSL